jgi:hypothetical protein
MGRQGTPRKSSPLSSRRRTRRYIMLKGGLLWLIGIPLPIIIVLYFLGVLS